jgi:hypothetical protein
METTHDIENIGAVHYKGSSFSVGLYQAIGMYIAIYGDLLLNSELKMNFAQGDWQVENQDEDQYERYEGLNTGGLAFKIGLAFRF